MSPELPYRTAAPPLAPAPGAPPVPGVARTAGVPDRLRAWGDWTLGNLGPLAGSVEQLALPPGPCTVDAGELTRLDTAGALLLVRLLRSTGQGVATHRIDGMRPEQRRLLDLVDRSLAAEGLAPEDRPGSMMRLLLRTGAALVDLGKTARDLLGFVGLTLQGLGALLIGRRRLRWTATVFHMEQVGVDAVPIVALLTFLVGSVVAFLGATVLRDFGASIYTVELVGFSFLREFGVLLTAILLAGRSSSAFTAQIGSMKSREEIDAIQTLGLDVVELLVLPRLLAMLVVLPLLTVVAMLAGLLGGALVSILSLDLTPAMFLARLQETTPVRHFWVGLSKAPLFALVISVVGCLEGLKVEGSAESVGRRTTSSVVQAIFLVIVVDALFAIWFMEMKL